MKNIFDLNNKVILITGGYGHLGGGMTRALLSYGATVIVAGKSLEKFTEKFKSIRTEKLYFEEFDISRESEYFTEKFTFYREKYGSLDVLINNAHFTRGQGNIELSDEDWQYSLDGVLGAIQKSIKTVVPIMRQQSKGKIINIASMYGHVSPNFERLYAGNNCEKYTNPAHYGAGKAGIIQLTKYYAALLGKDNIYVNAISPGPFPGEMVQKENPEFISRLKSLNPLQKIGKPDDLAGIIILLSSDSSNFITGQNFAIDGGWTIW